MQAVVRRVSIFQTELLNRYGGTTLAGVIYIHRISGYRFAGIAGQNFKRFRDLCGDTTLKNVVVVTNMWGDVSPEDGAVHESELFSVFFKPAFEKGAQMARHYNTAQSAHEIIRRIMMNHPVVLQIQRELVDEHRGIIDTSAGQAVNRELDELARRHQVELESVENEMKQALEGGDEETRQELEDRAKALREQMKIEKQKKQKELEREKEEKEARKRREKLEVCCDLASSGRHSNPNAEGKEAKGARAG